FPLECCQPPRGQETCRGAEGCRTTLGTCSVTHHEPGRWRGFDLHQRRATHEALNDRPSHFYHAHGRLLMQRMNPQLARNGRSMLAGECLLMVEKRPLTRTVERLQIKLFGGLGRDEFHSRALRCFGDRPGSHSFVPWNTGARTSPASGERRVRASVACG